MLNPSKDTRMRRLNPGTLMDSAKDVGMAAALAIPAALVVGGGMVAASKITYAPEAAGDMLSPASKRAGVVALGAIALGTLMQFHPATKKAGLAVGLVGVALPLTNLAANKIAEATAPAVAAVNPLVAAPAAPSAGFYGMSGNLMGARSPFLNPSGFAADAYGPFAPTGELSSSIASSSYIPPARG